MSWFTLFYFLKRSFGCVVLSKTGKCRFHLGYLLGQGRGRHGVCRVHGSERSVDQESGHLNPKPESQLCHYLLFDVGQVPLLSGSQV